jgi:hypothetical protein
MMPKPKAKSPFTGLWHIVSMSEWDEDHINEEVQAFIEFEPGGVGHFQFGLVSGNIDSLEAQRDGKPAVEWSWEGMAEMDECSGRGWATLANDELHDDSFTWATSRGSWRGSPKSRSGPGGNDRGEGAARVEARQRGGVREEPLQAPVPRGRNLGGRLPALPKPIMQTETH